MFVATFMTATSSRNSCQGHRHSKLGLAGRAGRLVSGDSFGSVVNLRIFVRRSKPLHIMARQGMLMGTEMLHLLSIWQVSFNQRVCDLKSGDCSHWIPLSTNRKNAIWWSKRHLQQLKALQSRDIGDQLIFFCAGLRLR